MASSCQPMFDLENRLFDDECTLADRNRQSDEVYEYQLANFYSTADCKNNDVARIAACHSNLHYRDGYGFTSGCVVDSDSTVRYGGQLTNSKHRRQLNSRVFQGHPHFERGAVQPVEEAALIQSDITREKKPCKGQGPAVPLIPLIPCIAEVVQNPDTIVVTQWQWGGEDTRSWVRDDDMIKKCGYTSDGRSWKKGGQLPIGPPACRK